MRESTTDEYRWERTAKGFLGLTADALLVIGFVLLANWALFTSGTREIVVRALFGLPMLFVIPGYAVVSALFPGRPTVGAGRESEWAIGSGSHRAFLDRGVDWHERVALSFGTSVALLPLLAIALSLLGFEYTVVVLSATLSGVAVLGMGLAVVRRSQLPVHRRFQLPYNRWIDRVNHGLFVQPSKVDVALNVGLAVIVVASLAGIGYAITAPNDAETFTSATLLTEDGQGDLVAGGYPDELGESGSQFVLRLENSEGETTSYTVVGELQRVQSTESSVRIDQRQEVLRTSTSLEDGESWTHPHTVQPELSGEEMRLIYYVYRDDTPADPDVESAYRSVHVWVDAPASASA